MDFCLNFMNVKLLHHSCRNQSFQPLIPICSVVLDFEIIIFLKLLIVNLDSN